MSAMPRFVSGLSFKLGLAFVFLGAVAIINALAIRPALLEQAGTAAVVSVAGRLRMLSQKLSAETLLILREPVFYPGAIESDIADFEAGLHAVENGGQAFGYRVKRPPGELDAEFSDVRQKWDTYRDYLRRTLRDPSQSDTRTDRDAVTSNAQQLLVSLESLISAANTAIREREQKSQTLMESLFVADIVCLLTAFLFIRRRVVKPIRSFAQVSEKFGTGHYHLRLSHPVHDEIGQLAQSFNRMADQIETDIARFAEEAQRQHDLWLSAKKLSEAVEHSPVSVVITNFQGIIEYVNPRFCETTGYVPEDVVGKSPSFLKSGQTPAAVYRQLWATIKSGQSWTGELLNRKKGGDLFWEMTRIAPLRNEDEEITHFVSVKVDITARKEADKKLRLRQRAVEASSNGIAMIDAERDDPAVIYVNPAFTRITGRSETDVVGYPAHALLGFPNNVALRDGALKPLNGAEEHTWIASAMHKDGTSFWCEYALTTVRDEANTITHYVAALTDVTERIDYEQRLAYQATHDALTGLANRALLADRIGQAISQANRYEQSVAVVLIDLDYFKNVNDTLGHAVGDLLLQVAAKRLAECVREIDTVARMGGDEFVILLTQVADTNEVETALQRIVEAIAAPYILEAHEAHVSCSVGACFYPKDGQTADELLRHADAAMYQAKDLGRNNFQFYQTAMTERLSHRVSMESQLRRALDREELFLHYQPQVDLRREAISGVEALVRWRHPELGIIPPGKFIPLAEESGLIVPLGAWVLQTACAQAQTWAKTGLPPIRIAVNLSVQQLKLKDFDRLIDETLSKTQLDPARLELEITESVVMQDPEAVVRLLRQIKECGLRIALDDFGTDYSSLNYLKRLPIDVLKIDQSFVRGIDTDRHDAALTRTVITLADCLGLHTIAEGVEVASQAAMLEAWGCHEAQGFLFHHPLESEELTRLLCADVCQAYAMEMRRQ